MKAHYFLLSLILPVIVGAQNTNSEMGHEEQALNADQAVKQHKEWQKERMKELKPKAE